MNKTTIIIIVIVLIVIGAVIWYRKRKAVTPATDTKNIAGSDGVSGVSGSPLAKQLFNT